MVHPPPEGMHTYFLARGDVARFKDILNIRLWLAGTGYCKLATPNSHTGVASILPRCLIDMTVFSPERLDYVAGAQIAKNAPFYQDRPEPELHPGCVLNLDSIPDVTTEEREEYQRLLSDTRARVAPEQRAKISAHIKAANPVLLDDEIEQQIVTRLDMAERGELEADHPLYFDNGTSCTAGTLSKKNDDKRLRDPLEPDYGRSQAVCHWRSPGNWRIVSWAHGVKRVYGPIRATQESPKGPFVTQNPSWQESLQYTTEGHPRATISNVALTLNHHEHWRGRFWFDVARNVTMLDQEPLSDLHVMNACVWFGFNMYMQLSSERMMERCLDTKCKQCPRDLLKEHLDGLPAWDGVERLQYWLADVAGVVRDAYGMAVSRIVPLSMVARALDPGCMYRYVVIFEGPEDSGKTSLIRALATDDWYVELTKGLDNKEAHMLLQGAWIAEMAELDSLSRTEETKLKAFITTMVDQWVPKYSNLKVAVPRRTIFIGSTNDTSYLKGETGNTRFLPIKTGDHIDVDTFFSMREQLFAEALHVYRHHPEGWWRFDQETLNQAVEERDARRVLNVYEDELANWLPHGPAHKDETTWAEIAERFLNLDKSFWKDKSLQMQIAAALRVLGWESHSDRHSKRMPGEVCRYWAKGRVVTTS